MCKKIIVGRPINGISINGLEYVLDDNDVEMKFDSQAEAETFLKENGCSDEGLEGFVFEEID